jgi:hypothetical protein
MYTEGFSQQLMEFYLKSCFTGWRSVCSDSRIDINRVCCTVLNNAYLLLKITLDGRNLMTDLFMNFISSVQNQLYPTNHMCQNCTRSSMALGQLLIGNYINQSVCWHPTKIQIGSRKVPLSIYQEYNVSKVSVLCATIVLKILQ